MHSFRWDLDSLAHVKCLIEPEGQTGVGWNLSCDIGLSRTMLTNSAPLLSIHKHKLWCDHFTVRELIDRLRSYIISLSIICPVLQGRIITLLLLQINEPRLREFEYICCSHKARRCQSWDSTQIYTFLHPYPFVTPLSHHFTGAL